MQAPLIPRYNSMLFLLLSVLFLCHKIHPEGILSGKEKDTGPLGDQNYRFQMHNGTVESSIENVSGLSYEGHRKTAKTATEEKVIATEKAKKLTFLENENEFKTEIGRQKRTVPYRIGSKDVDTATSRRKSQRLETGKNLNLRDHRRKPKLQSDYMMKIFECFTNLSCPHQQASLVRSLPNMWDTVASTETARIGNQRCTLYRFQFPLESLSRRETIVHAEFRLYVSSARARTKVAAKVSLVRKVGQLANAFQFTSNRVSAISSSVLVYGETGKWTTFDVTKMVKSIVSAEGELINLSACLENIYQNEMLNNFYIESLNAEYSPVLVIYSNERKQRKRATRSRQTLITKEVILDQFRSSKDTIKPIDHIDRGIGKQKRTITRAPRKSTYRIISKRRRRPRGRKTRNFRAGLASHIRNYSLTDFRATPSSELIKNVTVFQEITNISTSTTTTAMPMDFQGDDPRPVTERGRRVTRTLSQGKTRTKGRKRPRKKTPCSRSPMYVDFKEIGWDSWIIAPKGYNAFECSGRCPYPLNHGSPTRHAIIQTILHTNWPERASRACCVPTKLEPISILYVDEKDVVTYKYQYEGMVVSECGCR